jgi:flagellar hook-length control protein FliK
MSEAANIITATTQVPDIARGIGATGGTDLHLSGSYQFSSILRHLVDTPEKTLETAKGPEKDTEPVFRPKTVEDTRNADAESGQDWGDQRSATEQFTEQAVPVPEQSTSQDDQASADDHASAAPATDDTATANRPAPERAEYTPREEAVDDFVAAVLTPHAAPAQSNAAPAGAAATAGLKISALADQPNGQALETTPGQVTSKAAHNVLSAALTDQQFSKIGEDLHSAVQKNVKEAVEPPKPQAAGNILKSNQEQNLAQKLGLAQALSVHVDKGIDNANGRSQPLHTLVKGAHMAQLDNSGAAESFVGGNGAKGNSNGENIASDRKASANHGAIPSDKAFGQHTTADPSVNFGQSVRAHAAMAGVQRAAAAASTGTKALPINVDLSNLNAIGGPNGPSQISQTAKANPLTAARQPQKPPVPVEQIAVNIKNAIGEGADKITIKLHPAQLGRVEVRMELAKDGQLSAVILAEKLETLDMLQRDARGLERALQHAGLKTDAGSLNFGLKSQNSDGTEPGRERGNSHSGQPNEHADTPDGNAGQMHGGIYGQNQSRNGGIDIRV